MNVFDDLRINSFTHSHDYIFFSIGVRLFFCYVSVYIILRCELNAVSGLAYLKYAIWLTSRLQCVWGDMIGPTRVDDTLQGWLNDSSSVLSARWLVSHYTPHCTSFSVGLIEWRAVGTFSATNDSFSF